MLKLSYLAIGLQKYYHRVGNKLLFNNGQSLNQFALNMWECLGYKEIDASALSRIIHRERLFTKSQLDVFCSILKLDEVQKRKLQEALEKDLLDRLNIGYSSQNYSTYDTFDLLNFNVEHIIDLRKRGLMALVLEWSTSLIPYLERNLTKNTNGLYRYKFLNLLSNIYFEYSYAYASIFPSKKTFFGVKPFISKQLDIFKQTKNVETSIKARVISSYAYYSLGKDIKNRNYFVQSLNEIKSTPQIDSCSSEVELMRWRHVALSSIYLNNKDAFYAASNKIKEIAHINLDNPLLVYLVTALGTVARGQAFFNDSSSYQTLEKVKELDRKMLWYDPLRECETLWNEIQIIDHLDPQGKQYKKSIAKKGIEISKKYGYFRYINYFSQ